MPWLSRFFGDRPTVTGDRQVPQQPATKTARPPLKLDRHFRPSLHPDASVYNEMSAQFTQWALFDSKELFGSPGIVGTAQMTGVSSVAGTLKRWRGAFRTGPFHKSALCSAFMSPQSTGLNSDSYAKIQIFSDTAEATLVTSCEFHFGASPTDTDRKGGWQYGKEVVREIEGLSPETWYSILVTDESYGLIQHLSIAEIPSLTQQNDGYTPTNLTAESKLVARYRELLVGPQEALWKHGGASIINFSVDSQDSNPRQLTTNTPTNIIDNSSTTYGSSIPGYSVDLTGRTRLAGSGVPIEMSVCAASFGGAGGNGRVYLKDQNGTTICAITNGWSTVAAGWQRVTGTIPSSTTKLYLVGDRNGAVGELDVYAIDVIQWET